MVFIRVRIIAFEAIWIRIGESAKIIGIIVGLSLSSCSAFMRLDEV